MRQYICIEPSPDEFDDDDEIEDWDEMYGGIDEEDMVFSDRKDDDDG